MAITSSSRAHVWTLWVVAVACVCHAAEELLAGWLQWAPQALGINMPPSLFVVMNGVLVALAFLAARSGWSLPVLSVVIPTATLTNAICFHIVPTLLTRTVAPGLYTAVLLYLPFSTWAIVGAWRDGAPRRAIVQGVAMGVCVGLGVVWLARQL